MLCIRHSFQVGDSKVISNSNLPHMHDIGPLQSHRMNQSIVSKTLHMNATFTRPIIENIRRNCTYRGLEVQSNDLKYMEQLL